MERRIKDLPYTINDSGVITNINTGRVKKPTTDSQGYQRVLLWNAEINNTEGYYVHKLVAEYFLGEPSGDIKDPVLRFVDYDKSNCSAENLRWISRSQLVAEEHRSGGVYDCSWNQAKKKVIIGNGIETHTFESLSAAVRFIAEKRGIEFKTIWSRCSKLVDTDKHIYNWSIKTV